MHRPMPNAVAKSAAGGAKKTVNEEQEKKRIEELNQKNLEARQEFDFTEDEVSKKELYSWYGE